MKLNDNSIISSALLDIANFAYPEIYDLIEAQCLPISDRIVFNEEFDQSDGICVGLEFHHDGSRMIDISFFGRKWSRIIKDNIFPFWWRKVEDLCVNSYNLNSDSESNPFLISSAKKESQNANSLTNKKELQLSDYQIIECEIRDKQPSTAGIFVAINQGAINNEMPIYHSSHDIITNIYEIESGFKGQGKLTEKSIINRIVNILGDPIFLGIMVGRTHNLKLIFNIFNKLGKPINVEDALGLISSSNNLSDFLDQVNLALIALLEIKDASIRLCLDINSQENTVSPRICFEIFPTSRISETRNWIILDNVAQICDINRKDIEHVRATHRHLPIGKKKDPIVTMLVQKLSSPMQVNEFDSACTKSAILSHYKVCFVPGKQCSIKSYAYIKKELDI